MKITSKILLISLLSWLLTSCTSTKDLHTVTVNKDSIYAETLKDSIRVIKSEKSVLEQELRESQFASVIFDSTRCPKIVFPVGVALLNKDSIQRLVTDLNNAIDGLNNKVKVFADGSFEANGRVKKANYSIDRLGRLILERDATIDSFKQVLSKKKTEVKTDTTTNDLHKKTSFFSWWIILIIAILSFVGGIFFSKKMLDWTP